MNVSQSGTPASERGLSPAFRSASAIFFSASGASCSIRPTSEPNLLRLFSPPPIGTNLTELPHPKAKKLGISDCLALHEDEESKRDPAELPQEIFKKIIDTLSCREICDLLRVSKTWKRAIESGEYKSLVYTRGRQRADYLRTSIPKEIPISFPTCPIKVFPMGTSWATENEDHKCYLLLPDRELGQGELEMNDSTLILFKKDCTEYWSSTGLKARNSIPHTAHSIRNQRVLIQSENRAAVYTTQGQFLCQVDQAANAWLGQERLIIYWERTLNEIELKTQSKKPLLSEVGRSQLTPSDHLIYERGHSLCYDDKSLNILIGRQRLLCADDELAIVGYAGHSSIFWMDSNEEELDCVPKEWLLVATDPQAGKAKILKAERHALVFIIQREKATTVFYNKYAFTGTGIYMPIIHNHFLYTINNTDLVALRTDDTYFIRKEVGEGMKFFHKNKLMVASKSQIYCFQLFAED